MGRLQSEFFVFAFILYLLGAAITFSFLFDNWQIGRWSMLRRGLAVMAWPVYWVAFYGIIRAIETFSESLLNATHTWELVRSAYLICMLLFPAFYLFLYWETCADFVDCSATVGKSLLWAPFWPAYLAGSIFEDAVSA